MIWNQGVRGYNESTLNSWSVMLVHGVGDGLLGFICADSDPHQSDAASVLVISLDTVSAEHLSLYERRKCRIWNLSRSRRPHSTRPFLIFRKLHCLGPELDDRCTARSSR